MTFPQAAGAFRRTQLERSDQRVAWERSDQAFFAAGACHILAWACKESFPARPIEIAAARYADQQQLLHTYATLHGWAFDHSGWNLEPELLAVNADFEGHSLERVEVTVDLARFCEQYGHRMPHQYWRDPLPRAREYVARYSAPWV